MSEAFSEKNQLYLDGTTCIQDLHSPQAFVSTILQEIDSAQDQVILSALYLGTGSLESQIVEHAEKALQDTQNRPNFKITFFFDHSRGQRGNINSVTLLTDLVAKYHPRAQVFLYQMPQLRGFMDYLPLQLKELLGVYHCKFSVFDNKAILTGANLSYDYFTDRQDRYFLIGPHKATNKALPEDCALFNAHKGSSDAKQSDNTDHTAIDGTHNTLAQYLTSFAAVVSKESHSLLPDGTLQAPLSVRSGSSTMAADLLALVRESNAVNSDPNSDANTNTATNTSTTTTITPAPTRIHPLIQHSPLHIHQESDALLTLFTQPFISLHNALLCVATPYTNFRSVFLSSILSTLQNKCSVELCVPSVPAHGFGSAKGLKGFVPALHYYSLQVEADQYVSMYGNGNSGGSSGSGGCSGGSGSSGSGSSSSNGSSGSSGRIGSGASGVYSTYYYMRPQWTYHTKGIWLFPETMTNAQLRSSGGANGNSNRSSTSSTSTTNTAAGINTAKSTSTMTNTNTTPNNNMVTYIGSSNFGERSWSRDFELGFVLATSESPMQQLFQKEYLNMRQHCGTEYTPRRGCGVNASMYNSIRSSSISNRIGAPVVSVVPIEHLPRHSSVQKWLLYTVARVIRSFL